MITAKAASLLHWRVGQRIRFGGYSFSQVASTSGPPKAPPVIRLEATVVGIVALNDSVAEDQVDEYPTFVIFTPALTREAIAAKAAGFSEYTLSLTHGAGSVGAVERELLAAIPPGSVYNFHVTSVVEGEAQRAIKPEAIALGAFGAICLGAALLLAAQAVSRALGRRAQELSVLRALGATPSMTMVDALLGPVGTILLGSVLAAVVCVLLSPLAPLGAVQQVDPSPGFALDWTVLGAGFGLLVLGLCTASMLLARLVMSRGARPNERPPSRSLVGAWAARAGFPAPAVSGIRFALERGAGSDAAPVASAFLGVILAVSVVATTLTFASGLNTLVSTPRLYGWNWNYAIEQTDGGNVPAFATDRLGRDPLVAAWTGLNPASAEIDGQTVPILLTHPSAPISPPILAGHRLDNGHQIVLGGATLAALHKHIGNTVTVSYGTAQDAPIYVPPTKLRIVGTATFPAVGTSGALHTSMGTGALLPVTVEPPAFVRAITSTDPNNNGPAIVVVRLRAGVPPAAGLASLQRIAAATTKEYNADPASGGGQFAVVSVQQPAEIVNYRAMGATPAILAAALAVSAVAGLGLILVASVRRRRRDLAVLRTLGFVERQLGAVVSWQSSVVALVGAVVGVPIGVILGQALWSAFARAIDAVAEPSVPGVQLVLVGIGTLFLANVVALLPARRAAQTPAAVLLRAE